MADRFETVALRSAGGHEPVFEHAKIPFAKVHARGADRIDGGFVLIGEGIDLTRADGLGDAIFRLADHRVPTLCLAPAKGDLPYPAGDGAAALRFDRDQIVGEIDKRLSAAAWPVGGAGAAKGFVPTVIRGNMRLRRGGRFARLAVDRAAVS